VIVSTPRGALQGVVNPGHFQTDPLPNVKPLDEALQFIAKTDIFWLWT
jgi:hypothetical protein